MTTGREGAPCAFGGMGGNQDDEDTPEVATRPRAVPVCVPPLTGAPTVEGWRRGASGSEGLRGGCSADLEGGEEDGALFFLHNIRF